MRYNADTLTYTKGENPRCDDVTTIFLFIIHFINWNMENKGDAHTKSMGNGVILCQYLIPKIVIRIVCGSLFTISRFFSTHSLHVALNGAVAVILWQLDIRCFFGIMDSNKRVYIAFGMSDRMHLFDEIRLFKYK